jgi:hypothetical protein
MLRAELQHVGILRIAAVHLQPVESQILDELELVGGRQFFSDHVILQPFLEAAGASVSRAEVAAA